MYHLKFFFFQNGTVEFNSSLAQTQSMNTMYGFSSLSSMYNLTSSAGHPHGQEYGHQIQPSGISNIQPVAGVQTLPYSGVQPVAMSQGGLGMVLTNYFIQNVSFHWVKQ